MLANAAYMASIGLGAHTWNLMLQKARTTLRERERILKDQLAEIGDLQVKLQEQALRDPLTGLYNRRFLDTIGSRQLARCERESIHLSIMMMDVDHFKAVNDTYGIRVAMKYLNASQPCCWSTCAWSTSPADLAAKISW